MNLQMVWEGRSYNLTPKKSGDSDRYYIDCVTLLENIGIVGRNDLFETALINFRDEIESQVKTDATELARLHRDNCDRFRAECERLKTERDSLRAIVRLSKCEVRQNQLEVGIAESQAECARMRGAMEVFLADGCFTGDCPHDIQTECDSHLLVELWTMRRHFKFASGDV